MITQMIRFLCPNLTLWLWAMGQLSCQDDTTVIAPTRQGAPFAHHFQPCLANSLAIPSGPGSAPQLALWQHGTDKQPEPLSVQALEASWQEEPFSWPALCPGTQTMLQRALSTPSPLASGQAPPVMFHHTGQSSLCLVSGYSGQVPDYLWTALANHLHYAQRHGYHYWAYVGQQPHAKLLGEEIELAPGEQKRAVIWEKLHWIRQTLAQPECAWVLWIDGDVLFTKMDTPLPQAVQHQALPWPSAVAPSTTSQAPYLLLTAEQAIAKVPINAGVILLRQHDWTFRFLQAILSLFSAYASVELQEQTAITDVVFGHRYVPGFDLYAGDERNLLSQVAILPQRRINSFYRPGFRKRARHTWHPGDFLMHISGAPSQIRLQVMQTVTSAMGLHQAWLQPWEPSLPPAKLPEDGQTMAGVAQRAAQSPYLLQQRPALLSPPLLWSYGYFDLVLAQHQHLSVEDFEQMIRPPLPLESRPPPPTLPLYTHPQGFLWFPSAQDQVEMPMALQHFITEQLANLQHPVTLITTGGQQAMPSQWPPMLVQAILQSPWVQRWYVENFDGTLESDKLIAIPKGPDFTPQSGMTSQQWMQQFLTIRHQRLPQERKIPAILLDTHHLPQAQRQAWHQAVQSTPHVHSSLVQSERLFRWQQYSQYRFVWFPKGHQGDLSALWEAMILGAIPIVPSSPRDHLLQGWPAIIVSTDSPRIPSLSFLEHWLDSHQEELVAFTPLHHLSRMLWLGR